MPCHQRLNVFPMRCVGFDTNLVKRVVRALKGEQAVHQEERVPREKDVEVNGKGKKRSRSADSDGLRSDSLASGPKRRAPTKRSERTQGASRDAGEEHFLRNDEDENGDEEDDGGQSDYDPGNTMAVSTRSLASSTRPRRSTRNTT